jgi:2-amino-4-hydroxy-6-hydroxymethyldihydropteridine diphosphokinase
VIKQDISENLANTVYLSIGSNLGNKKNNIIKTQYLLERNSIKIIKSSNIYETYSWPNKNYPKYYNIVIKILTKLQPIDLFFTIKDIEKELGRKKSKINYPRICDIDILDYNGLCYKLEANNNKLLIPHPRLHMRNFVLFPLFEIEKNWKHPSNKTKVHDLLGKLDNSSLYSIKQI